MAAASDVDRVLSRFDPSMGLVVFLTGAGISAESGIPTFRGPDGYWRVGSKNYHPEELATRSSFDRDPELVWSWYLYRRAVCLGAEPNPAHRAIHDLETALGDRFLLVTQNVDGLHQRAGSTRERTYAIHGHLERMRCAAECTRELLSFPDGVGESWERGRALGPTERVGLRCPRCGEWTRPHVLWFDECYDESWYRFESAIRAARAASLLVVVGTAGQTNLPFQMVSIAHAQGTPLLVINQDRSPFSDMAEEQPLGAFLRGPAGELVPDVAAAIVRRTSG